MINNFQNLFDNGPLNTGTNLLPKFPGYFWASTKFQDISGILLNFQDVSRIVGWGWEI